MIVILDHDEKVIEFMDDADAAIDITDTYQGYKSLDFSCKLSNVRRDQELFKQGNKLFLENVLFVINTEVDFDYVNNTINVEAEELVYELNNCECFYIKADKYRSFVRGNTVEITPSFLNALFQGFYVVDTTDLPGMKYNQRIVTVNGTITKYKLLKEIESATGLVFKYSYALNTDNTIAKKVSLLKPENYGVTHDKLLERVTIGENTNKLEYSSDETKNALGIMPIINAEPDSSVDYAKILREFSELDINNEKVMPYYSNWTILEEDLIYTAKTIHEKIETFGHIPDKVQMLLDDDEVLDIGLSQFVDMASSYILKKQDLIPVFVVEPPEFVKNTTLDCVFSINEIFLLAEKVQDYIKKTGHVQSNLSTNHGLLTFQWLIYIFAEYITTKKQVVCKSRMYPNLNNILPDFVQYNVKYIVNTEEYEYMPFLYTQNTSESSAIPYRVPINPPPNNNYYDVTKYISESLPVMVITKQANAEQIIVTITKKNISQETAESFTFGFKEVDLIQDNTDLTIDFAKREIKFMKFFEWIEQKEVEVTETVGNDNVITANYYPTCQCCGGSVEYKRYTKTFLNHCPECGKDGTLGIIPKSVDGEITCLMSKGGCDSDYCCYCGGEKDYGKCNRFRLTPADAAHEETRTETVEEVHQEYKEVIASDDNSGEDETKIRLNDCLTENSKLDSMHGDISIKIQGATLKSLNCDSTKLFEMSPFPYIKQRGEMFIYAPVTAADFNYTHMTNNNPKLEPFETSEQSIEEVLIGCWKKLNGSGDNTDWLAKAEDINIDLSEENLDLNAGDFVYIKLPDELMFKAQIVEKKYDPKIKSDSSLKIGNVSRESIA